MLNDDIKKDNKKEVPQDDAVKKLMAQVEDIKKRLEIAALIVGIFLPPDDKKPDGK